MDTLTNIFSRRSIRNYTGETISQEELDILLKAAYASPIAIAQYDSCHITVITNKEWLKELEDDTMSDFIRLGKRPFYNAPMLILMSSTFEDPDKYNNNYSNCAIIAEHIALACTELGIGHVLIWGAIRHLNKRPDLIEKLNLPKGFKPSCAIAVGKTKEKYTLREIKPNRIKTEYFK